MEFRGQDRTGLGWSWGRAGHGLLLLGRGRPCAGPEQLGRCWVQFLVAKKRWHGDRATTVNPPLSLMWTLALWRTQNAAEHPVSTPNQRRWWKCNHQKETVGRVLGKPGLWWAASTTNLKRHGLLQTTLKTQYYQQTQQTNNTTRT